MSDANGEHVADGPRVIAVDSLWFDPLLLTDATTVQWTDVPCVMNVIKRAVPQRSNRIGIGFYQSSAPTNINVAPWGDVDKFIQAQTTLNVAIPFIKLFDFGPLICNAWYIFASANTTVRVVEWTRN